jgi:hypothetical protein
VDQTGPHWGIDSGDGRGPPPGHGPSTYIVTLGSVQATHQFENSFVSDEGQGALIHLMPVSTVAHTG